MGFLGVAAIAVPTISEGSSEAIGFLMALVAVVCYGFAITGSEPYRWVSGVAMLMAKP